MNLVEGDGLRRMTGCFLGGLLLATLVPSAAIAQAPIASSNFVGFEDPLSENGAWAAMTSMAPQGTRFQKNNMALPDGAIGPGNNHAGARTTAAVPTDHYSEIVVGHVGLTNPGQIGPYVGPLVRVQTSGASIDSDYMWWGTQGNGDNNLLYRIDATGTSYVAIKLLPHPPFNDGDRVRLIARGPVIYGIRNGVREFIYNTGANAIKYPTGTAGMLAFVPVGRPLTDATITSWSTGPAPVSSGTWASSTFAGTENPLDEGDRWYPLAVGDRCQRRRWSDRSHRPHQRGADGMAALHLCRQPGGVGNLQTDGRKLHPRCRLWLYAHHRPWRQVEADR